MLQINNSPPLLSPALTCFACASSQHVILHLPHPPSMSLPLPPDAGSVFWSTLVTWVNGFARLESLPEEQQNYLSVIILLMFLLILPFIFDTLARNYEGMKLESEIQNAIMARCASPSSLLAGHFTLQISSLSFNLFSSLSCPALSISSQVLLLPASEHIRQCGAGRSRDQRPAVPHHQGPPGNPHH